MYAPALWPATAAMLAELEQGVTDLAGELVAIDLFGMNMDAFWSITAADGDHERGVEPYLRSVRHTWGMSRPLLARRGYIGDPLRLLAGRGHAARTEARSARTARRCSR